MSIAVKDITKYYGEQKALDHISFTVEEGAVTGFLGPNGAGKSTMMKIITGFLPPSSGEVFVDDLNVRDHLLEIRKQIGYLPEHNPLYPEMYIREYLNYVAGLYHLGSLKKTKVEEVIRMTGLQPEQHKKIGALSKGYRQRVGLAQALLHDPQVLILDEPTSGLDPNQIIEIRQLIKQLGHEKTVLLSTHIMQEVEAVCDRVIIIHKGRIIADGAEKELVNLQLQDSSFKIHVEFKESLSPEKLYDLEHILEIIPQTGRSFTLLCNKDIREDIFRFATEHALILTGLFLTGQNLEEVFRELTMEG